MEWSFGGARRLRARSEFDRVFQKGRRLGGRFFVVIALPNESPQHRLGLAVGRKIGGAVTRNRTRRLLRESFRRLTPPVGPGFDLVVVARADIVGRSQSEVDGELRDRIRRLADRSGSRRASGPASH
ncbi:MAG: ribonuclease P protein component [Acidobacteria bacterium]|nr:ribonuclease P protein component [Acidobacteriota bacterium]